MRKLILWLAILLPTFANAQWVNGVIQRDNTSTWIRYMQGANQVRLALYSDLAAATDTTVLRTVANSYSLAGMQNKLNGYVTTNTSQNITGPKTFTSLVQGSNGFRTTSGLTYSQLDASGQSLTFATSSASLIVGYNTLTTNRTINFPDASGTVALLSSPAFTGTPTAPTATGGTNTTQIATTAFVQSAVSGLSQYWNRSGTTLSPATANDNVSITYAGSTAAINLTNSSGSAGNALNITNSGNAPGVSITSNAQFGLNINSNSTGTTYNSANSGSGHSYQAQHSGTGSAFIASSSSSGRGAWINASNTYSGTPYGYTKNSVDLWSINNTGSMTIHGVTSAGATGTNNLVFSTSPTLVTPNIGAATGTSLSATGGISGSSGMFSTGAYTTNGVTTVSSNGTTGPHIAGNTDAANLSVVNAGAGRVLLGGAGIVLQQSPATTIGVSRTWSDHFTVSTSGVVTINNLGSGSMVSSAGVVGVTSDSRLKKVGGTFKGSAIDAIIKLPNPRYWNYNAKSGYPKEAQEVKQFGLLADKVFEVLGEEFAPTQKDGFHGMSDRALLGLAIQAIKELKKEINELKNK